MCGIAGIVETDKSSKGSTIKRMTDALRHRGPDGWGYVELNPGEKGKNKVSDIPGTEPRKVWLGHRRLSIIDLKGSKQPLRNEDGTVWVVFNGEIYNYLELRTNLLKMGHILREAGDTEVLVHLWEEYGNEMVDHLIGMFAFAIYDTRKNVTFLVRDRFGQKPLYYWQDKNLFAFASEIQGLWALDTFPFDDLDERSVSRYFRYGYIPGPHTIYKNVRSLQPGHFMMISEDNQIVKRYWRPKVKGRDNHCTLDEYEQLLDEATKIRLRSDVPLGAFLSGGIDSALIVASMARQMENPIETFTITTGESWCDESNYARITSAHFGTNHHEFKIIPDLVGITQKLAGHFGQPFADYSCVPTYYISRETRKHVTVALSGDGGDELFAGYMRYANYRWSRLIGIIPWKLRQMFSGIFSRYGNVANIPAGSIGDFILSAGNVIVKGENPSAYFHRYWRKRCLRPEHIGFIKQDTEDEIERFTNFYKEAVSDNPLEKWLEVDQRMFLADDILTKVDISSMAVSLECRAPFLDHRLAEEANKVPIYKKLQNRRSKVYLRDLAARRVPEVIPELPKKGFTLPLSIWLRNELKDWAYDIIFTNQTSWEFYLRKKIVHSLWQEHQAHRHDHSMRLWMIISWIMWVKAKQEAVKR